jgi:hypothetical protein
MNDTEKLYLDSFILYKITGKIHVFVTTIKNTDVREIYRNKDFEEKIKEICEIVEFFFKSKKLYDIISTFIITNEVTDFKVENEYDACSILNNWWYFKNFDLFSNKHISYKVFNDWVVKHYNKQQQDIDKIVEKLQTLNIDYVTFIY